jgi:hypothetical protein
MSTTDLELLNQGDKPYLERQETIDLALCSKELVRDVCEWGLLPELSLLDHRQILFSLVEEQGKNEYRNP